jgi:Cd2+/Zn2+-exporting ATPase
MRRYGVVLSGYRAAEQGTEVLVAKAGQYLGQIIIGDTIKADASQAIASLQQRGITTVMLTGDTATSAEAVGKSVGIAEVHAELLPQDKLTELSALRARYGAVMFVGDGINDAPVLAGADVGAAMGSGADAAIEAADVVFLNSDMQAIPQAIKIAVKTNRIAWQNVYFALIVKVVIMIAGLLGCASMWAAVFADTGVALLCVCNSIRILYERR